MPAPISYAHNLTKALTACRKSGELPWLRPDGKGQVSVQYAADGTPERIDTVVVSTQHAPDIAIEDLSAQVIEKIIQPEPPVPSARREDEILCQPDRPLRHRRPCGRFGPDGPQDHRRHLRRLCRARRRRVLRQGPDKGRPQRRIHGPLHREKNIVAAGLADKCQLQLAYAIGVAQPCPCWPRRSAPAKFPTQPL